MQFRVLDLFKYIFYHMSMEYKFQIKYQIANIKNLKSKIKKHLANNIRGNDQ